MLGSFTRHGASCVAALLLLLPLSVGLASSDSAERLKEKALAEYDRARYASAIEYLEQAREAAPNDAEVYYLLGSFTHYLCYDSVPLSGYGRHKSDEVLAYLRKAVELDPNLGNAYYFIGAEYGVRARDSLRDGDVKGAADQFRRGKQEGGFPAWMLEFGRNLLKSCPPDAILFTGGDADSNPVEFLQIVEEYRTDVTVIPVALLERSSFVGLIKHGLEGAVRPAPVSWSDEQIEDMHPYKWQTNTIKIPIAAAARRRYDAKRESIDWELKAGGDGRLSAGRAALADILITNRFDRPVYFSSGVSNSVFDGLDEYVQLSGVARHLIPVDGLDNIDVETTQKIMLEPGNFDAVPTVRTQDMPRVSNLLVNYWVCYLYLALEYSRSDDAAMVEKVIATMKQNVPLDIMPMPEGLRNSVDKLERWASENR
jgi:tetratricopeptide (TPR) repeat protein